MRILIAGTGRFHHQLGGGQVYVRNLCRELHQAGHKVTAVCNIDVTVDSKWHGRIPSVVDGVSVSELLCFKKFEGASYPTQLGGLSLAIHSLLAELTPDVVHANADKVLYARICKEVGIPCVVTAHHGGIVCPTGALLHHDGSICKKTVNPIDCEACVIKSLPAPEFGKFLVAVTPGFLRHSLETGLSKVWNIPFVSQALRSSQKVRDKIAANSDLGKSATLVICPSEAIRGAMIRNGTPAIKTIVVPHGIPNLSTRPPVTGLPGRPLRFGFVGRINRVKGFHVLLEALKLLTGAFEFRAIGAAHSKWEKRFLARSIAVCEKRTSIMFSGHLEGEDLLGAIAECDVIVVPSICLEVFGLVILEAWALGRPVIVTDSGGPGEIVKDGLGGFVVPPNNPQALRGALQKFIDNPNLVEEMAKKIPAVRSIKEHVQDLLRIYEGANSKQ